MSRYTIGVLTLFYFAEPHAHKTVFTQIYQKIKICFLVKILQKIEFLSDLMKFNQV